MRTRLDELRAAGETRLVVRASVELDPAGVDLDAGTFRAVLASDAPIDSILGPLVLSHDAGSAEFPDDAPVLVGHDRRSLPIGRWTGFAVRAGRTRATATLATRHRETILRDIAEGVVTDVSVAAAFNFDDLEDRESDGAIVARRWRLEEASLVGIGADPAGKIDRSQEGTTMPPTTPQPAKPEAHAERVAAIRALFTGLPETEEWRALRVELLEDTESSIEVLRDKVIAKLKAQAGGAGPSGAGSDEQLRAQPGRDATDKLKEGFSEALRFKTGLVARAREREVLAELRKGSILSMSLLEVAREFLRVANVDVAGLTRDEIARRALFHRAGDGFAGYGLGDLTQVLAANVNMAMSLGYDEAEESWPIWTGRDQAPDFKSAHRPVMSAFSDLEQVHGSGEYTWGHFGDKEEVFQLETWGRLFGIGRPAIINDSLNVFGRVPRAMGRAAARKVGDEVYLVLNLTSPSPATMGEDGVALFNAATHGNYIASGSGAAPSVATLNTGRAAMATQSDVARSDGSQATVAIRAKYLITSEALITTAEVLVAAANNPATASGVEPMPGWIGRLVPVSDYRIDNDVATAWYLAANQAMHDTVLVAFLDGISVPTLEQHDPDPSRDGVIFKVRHDFVAYPGDWRTLFANYGA